MSVYPQAAAIISKILGFMRCKPDRKLSCIKQIHQKFSKKPNTGYLDIWLQRISYKLDANFPCAEPLCKTLAGNAKMLWKNDWLKSNVKSVIDNANIVDAAELARMEPIITNDEIDLFKNVYPV